MKDLKQMVDQARKEVKGTEDIQTETEYIDDVLVLDFRHPESLKMIDKISKHNVLPELKRLNVRYCTQSLKLLELCKNSLSKTSDFFINSQVEKAHRDAKVDAEEFIKALQYTQGKVTGQISLGRSIILSHVIR